MSATDVDTLRAHAAATYAEHERERVTLLSRLDAEARRQRSRGKARREERAARREAAAQDQGQRASSAIVQAEDEAAAKKRGEALRRHGGALADMDANVQAAVEWVYVEHAAQMATLKARLAAERAEQLAHLEARRRQRQRRHGSRRRMGGDD